MAIQTDKQLNKELIFDAAKSIVTAARTAPKTRGRDTIFLGIVDDKATLEQIANHMRLMHSEQRGAAFFLRDADNIDNIECLVLIGTKIEPMQLPYCGLCGYKDCDEKLQHPAHPCAFNTTDLGIAIGSAVSKAADLRVDNRVMFSVGMAVRELKLLSEEAKIIIGIPLSISGKNPFFDRKPKK